MTPSRGFGLVRRADLLHVQVRLPKLDGAANHARMSHHQRPAPFVDDGFGPCADDDFRPDARRVAQSDCDQGFCFHIGILRGRAEC